MDTYEEYTVYVSRNAPKQIQKKFEWAEFRHRIKQSNKPLLVFGYASLLGGAIYFISTPHSSSNEPTFAVKFLSWMFLSLGALYLSMKDVELFDYAKDESFRVKSESILNSQDEIEVDTIEKKVQEKRMLEEAINQRKIEILKLINSTKIQFEIGKETHGLLKLLSDGYHEIFQEIKNITLLVEKGASHEICDKGFYILERHNRTGEKFIREIIPPQNNWRSGIKPSYYKAVYNNYDAFNDRLDWLSS